MLKQSENEPKRGTLFVTFPEGACVEYCTVARVDVVMQEISPEVRESLRSLLACNEHLENLTNPDHQIQLINLGLIQKREFTPLLTERGQIFPPTVLEILPQIRSVLLEGFENEIWSPVLNNPGVKVIKRESIVPPQENVSAGLV